MASRVEVLARLLAITVATTLSACSSTTSPEAQTGSVTVTLATTGVDQDAGYTVTIGSTAQGVTANGSVTFPDVPAGSASVQLSDIAPNCAVTGSNPVVATVTADETVTASFAVACVTDPGPLPGADVDSLLALATSELEARMFQVLDTRNDFDTLDIDFVDSFSFAEANRLFTGAYSLEPTRDLAAFGSAITDIFMLEDDLEIRALVDQWDDYLSDDTIVVPPAPAMIAPAVEVLQHRMSLPLGFSTTKLEDLTEIGLLLPALATSGPSRVDPPTVLEHQAVLRDVVRPTLVEALDKLLTVGDDFVFILTEAMQGEDAINADPLELDFTEVLTMQAGLHVAVAAIDVATAYVLAPDPTTVGGAVDALTPGSTFLTLGTGGEDLLGDALTRLQAAGPILIDAIDELESEVDDQSDDIIKVGLGGGDLEVASADLAEARSIIADITAALSGPTTVTLEEGTPEEVSFTLDAAEFFTDPISDLKDLLPDYEVFAAMEGAEEVAYLRWDALELVDWTFPDPSFSGVLPDIMTTTDLLDFDDELALADVEVDVADFFYGASLASGYYRLITVDGVDCAANVDAGGQGCLADGEYYRDAFLDLYGGYRFATDPMGAPLDVRGAYADLQLSSTSFIADLRAFGTYGVTTQSDAEDTPFDIDMDLVLTDGSMTPAAFVGELVDDPGFDSVDALSRTRGGSTLEFTFLGSTWVFERQH